MIDSNDYVPCTNQILIQNVEQLSMFYTGKLYESDKEFETNYGMEYKRLTNRRGSHFIFPCL